MSQEAIYHIPDFHFDYYCIIPHTTQPQVLILCEENGWSLPYFMPYEHHYAVVGHINQEMKAQLGLDVTTLRCFYDSEVDDQNYNRESRTVCRVYAMENHSPHWILPNNARWVELDQLNSLTFASRIRQILESWFAEITSEKIGKQRVPWAEIGWFEQAAAWINLQLNSLGLIAIAPIEQLKNWRISCLIKVSTKAGSFYFKAVPPAFASEPAKTHLLAQFFTNHMPNLLAVDTEKQWMLMQDFAGKHLEKIPDVPQWKEALRLFAEIQIQAVDKVDRLLDFGFPDRRLDQLIGQIDLLFTDTSALVLQQNRGVSETELETLRSLVPQLVAMCHELAVCGIPPTLVHGDFHCQNVVVTDEGYVYFDWSDAAIGHPFFDIVYFLQEYEKQLPDVTDVQVRLRNVYLEPWTVYLPMEQLIEVFEKARPLTVLYRAIVDYQVTRNMEDEAKQEWEQVVPYWLKSLLKQIQLASEDT